MQAPALYHLTLNTGHVVMQDRDQVPQDLIDRLLPIVDAQGGPAPSMDGWYLEFVFRLDAAGARLPGSAFFQVADEPGLSRRPAAMAVLCWDAAQSAACWEQVEHSYTALHLALAAVGLWREMPPAPPPLPWLAVWLLPYIVLADERDARAIGALEYAVAWAVMP